MTKYKLSEERRSQSEVTLTGYLPSDNMYDNPAFTNNPAELHVNGLNGLTPNGVDGRNIRSNSCTCSEKGELF